MTPVTYSDLQSTCIDSIEFHPGEKVLIEFKKSRKYEYFYNEEFHRLFEDKLKTGESVGSVVSRYVRTGHIVLKK